jgi:hypothetical protein
MPFVMPPAPTTKKKSDTDLEHELQALLTALMQYGVFSKIA